MRKQLIVLFSLVLIAAIAGCSKPAEAPSEPAAASAATAPVEELPAPQAASTPAAAPAAEPAPAAAAPSVTLPEGFTAHFHVNPEMTLTGVEILNADEAAYKVTGELRASTLEVLNYFVKYFRDNGWEEDMIMEQEGNTVVSFKKDGYLQYIDSHEGGIGAKITITTGKA